MAWLVGCEHIDRVRAIYTIDAASPLRAKAPDNDPINRLAFYIAQADKSPLAARLKALATRIGSGQVSGHP